MQGEAAGRDTRVPERNATAEDRSDGERQTGQQVRWCAPSPSSDATFPAGLRGAGATCSSFLHGSYLVVGCHVDSHPLTSSASCFAPAPDSTRQR